jgi:hypothetical protein
MLPLNNSDPLTRLSPSKAAASLSKAKKKMLLDSEVFDKFGLAGTDQKATRNNFK